MYFAQCLLNFNKKAGKYLVLGKIKRIITMIQVKLMNKQEQKCTNELVINQETPINHQTKLALHTLTKYKFYGK